MDKAENKLTEDKKKALEIAMNPYLEMYTAFSRSPLTNKEWLEFQQNQNHRLTQEYQNLKEEERKRI